MTMDDTDREAAELVKAHITVHFPPSLSEMEKLIAAVAARLRERDEHIANVETGLGDWKVMCERAHDRIAALEQELRERDERIQELQDRLDSSTDLHATVLVRDAMENKIKELEAGLHGERSERMRLAGIIEEGRKANAALRAELDALRGAK